MKMALLLPVVLALTVSAAAQKNDIGVLVGGHFPIDTTTSLSIGHAFMVEGSYAREFARVPLLGVSAELPVVGSFNSGLSGLALSFSGAQVVRNYSSLVVTPGLKLKIAPGFPVSPYFVAGIGVAHFRSSSTLTNNTPNPNQTSNKAAFAIGGGLDIKFLPVVGVRLEFRDILTSTPTLSPVTVVENLLGLPTHQHNLLAGIGLALRF